MDLRTDYLGMTLKNPIVPSSSPLSRSVDSIRRLEDAGASAVVMYSLFEEQITSESFYLDYYLSHGTDSYAESLDYFPEMQSYNVGPDEYLELIRRAKEAVDIPIIGSLNGTSTGGWIDYARSIEEACADALELNVYYIPTSTYLMGAEVEYIYTDILHEVRNAVEIPVAMKLSPYFSSTSNMAQRLAEGGADGLVLFNRFYQPDIDIRTMKPSPHVELSTSAELLLRLRWLAILHGRVRPSLAVTGGVATPNDGIKAVLAGADAVQMVSALLRHGPAYLSGMCRGLEQWLEWNKVASLDEVKGRVSLRHTSDPAAFERANYIRALQSWSH